MTDIVISEFMDEAVVRSAFEGRDVLYDATLVDQPERLARALLDARALIVRNRTQVRGALLAEAPKLRIVGRLGVGLDNIDVDACKARGIAVQPASGANDAAVAEYVITAALVLLRRAWFATSEVAGGDWPRTRLIGREAGVKSLGLVGFGAIGRATARRALALGMGVQAFDSRVSTSDPAWGETRPVSLETLLAESDVVSLHV